MENFDFNIGKTDVPTITLSNNGLSFNGVSISALGYPEFISMGLDRENKKLAVKANDEGSQPLYRFVTDEKKKKRILLTASKICVEIFKLTGLKPVRLGIRYTGEFDKDSGLLIFDLSKA